MEFFFFFLQNATFLQGICCIYRSVGCVNSQVLLLMTQLQSHSIGILFPMVQCSNFWQHFELQLLDDRVNCNIFQLFFLFSVVVFIKMWWIVGSERKEILLEKSINIQQVGAKSIGPIVLLLLLHVIFIKLQRNEWKPPQTGQYRSKYYILDCHDTFCYYCYTSSLFNCSGMKTSSYWSISFKILYFVVIPTT